MCTGLADVITQGVTFITTAWIPREAWITTVAGIAFWYGRQVALTYAPGIIAKGFISMTASYVGIGGAFLGATVVAPMLTPPLVGLVATAVGFALLYIVGVIGNLVQKYLITRCC